MGFIVKRAKFCGRESLGLSELFLAVHRSFLVHPLSIRSLGAGVSLKLGRRGLNGKVSLIATVCLMLLAANADSPRHTGIIDGSADGSAVENSPNWGGVLRFSKGFDARGLLWDPGADWLWFWP